MTDLDDLLQRAAGEPEVLDGATIVDRFRRRRRRRMAGAGCLIAAVIIGVPALMQAWPEREPVQLDVVAEPPRPPIRGGGTLPENPGDLRTRIDAAIRHYGVAVGEPCPASSDGPGPQTDYEAAGFLAPVASREPGGECYIAGFISMLPEDGDNVMFDNEGRPIPMSSDAEATAPFGPVESYDIRHASSETEAGEVQSWIVRKTVREKPADAGHLAVSMLAPSAGVAFPDVVADSSGALLLESLGTFRPSTDPEILMIRGVPVAHWPNHGSDDSGTPLGFPQQTRSTWALVTPDGRPTQIVAEGVHDELALKVIDDLLER